MQHILFYVLFSFWISINMLYGQGNKYNIDSLGKCLDILEGEERISTLLDMSQAHKYINYKQSLQYAQEALSLSKTSHNPSHLSKSEENLGAIYENQTLRQKSIIHYKKALEIYTSLKNKDKEVLLHQKISTLYWYLQDYDNAIKYSTANLIFYETEKKWLEAGKTAYNLAKVCQTSFQEDLALTYLKKGANYTQKVGDLRTWAVIVHDLAAQQERFNQKEEALKNYLKAFPCLKEQYNYAKVPQNLWAIANLYKNQKSYTQALIYFQDLKEWCDEMGNQKEKLAAIYEISAIYFYTQQYHKALTIIEEGLSMNEEFHLEMDKLYQMNINILITLQEYQKAFNYQKEYLLPKKLKMGKIVSTKFLSNSQFSLD